jgi:hypothetical protein
MIEAAAPAGTITQAILVAAPRRRGRRGSSEPPPTHAPAQPPGRGDGDRKRSRQVTGTLRLVLHRPGRQSSKGDRAAACRCANGANAGVPQDQAGLAAALITASFQLGSAGGLAVFSGIATSRTSHLLAALTPPPEAPTAGFQRTRGCPQNTELCVINDPTGTKGRPLPGR